LSDADKSYLKKLEPVYQEREFTLVHGTLEHPEEFDYIIDEMQAARTIHLQITQACFVGHSHVAGIFFDDKKGYIHYTTAPQVNMLDGHHYLINVGSIGQPRDGDWRASYCLYDTDKNILQIKRVEYDVRKASDKILKAGLPSQLAIRILSGR
jgi:diadenosine tetraphosphatase ApaH/serine/threonine PP2A family protein phosphatase